MKKFIVFIEFHENALTEKEVEKIIADDVAPEDIVSLSGHKAEILWRVPEYDAFGDIENELFYFLNGGDYGVCTHYEEHEGETQNSDNV